MDKKESKNRILTMYNMLINNKCISKSKMAIEFGVSEKTVRRDINEIQTFFSEHIDEFGEINIEYSRKRGGFLIRKAVHEFGTKEILLLIKILLGSRGLCKNEVKFILDDLMGKLSKEDRENIKSLIGNELQNYIAPRHNKNLAELIWEIGDGIRKHRKLLIRYKKNNGIEKEVEICPKGLIFSEYYFYLIANTEKNDDIIYRVDRIESFKVLEEKFFIKEVERFKDGEFRKNIQFMQKDELIKVKFGFSGDSVEAILDRVPTTKIVNKVGEIFILEGTVHKRGIKMWLLSQGKNVQVIKPKELIEELKDEIREMYSLY